MTDFSFLWVLVTPATLGAAIRWALSLVGGVLVAKGWLTSEQAPEVLAAAATALVPLIWGILQKLQQRKALDAALSLPSEALPAGTAPGVILEAAKAQP